MKSHNTITLDGVKYDLWFLKDDGSRFPKDVFIYNNGKFVCHAEMNYDYNVESSTTDGWFSFGGYDVLLCDGFPYTLKPIKRNKEEWIVFYNDRPSSIATTKEVALGRLVRFVECDSSMTDKEKEDSFLHIHKTYADSKHAFGMSNKYYAELFIVDNEENN